MSDRGMQTGGSTSEPGASLTRRPVTAVATFAEDVHILELSMESDFVPGQCVSLTVDPGVPPRIYSIASAPNGRTIEILYDVVADGLLTPRLAKLTPGSGVLVSEPFGSFVDAPGSAWIATGTGVAPFRAMSQALNSERTVWPGSARGQGPGRRHADTHAVDGDADTHAVDHLLVHGARTLKRFYFSSELEQALGRHYVRCLSGPAGSSNHLRNIVPGRLTAWLERVTPLPPFDRYMICGSAEMIVDVRDVLISRGVPYGSIIAEIYF